MKPGIKHSLTNYSSCRTELLVLQPRLNLRTPIDHRHAKLFQDLGWLSIEQLIAYYTAVMMYKVQKGLVSDKPLNYLSQLDSLILTIQGPLFLRFPVIHTRLWVKVNFVCR